MKKELNNFIIESNVQIDYFDEIIDFILKNEKDILLFFKIRNVPNKIRIEILNYDSFKEAQMIRFNKITDYVRGITDEKNNKIIVLTLEDQIKYTTHKDACLDDMLKMILHEIVHSFNSIINKDHNQLIWFREGLATNLANQNYKLMDLNICNFDALKSDFYNSGKYNYAFAHTIVNYILNNLDENEIDKLITDSDFLRNNSDRLFLEAKDYTSNKKIIF